MRSLFGAFLLIALVCTVPNAAAFERTNHITQHILTLVQTGYSVDTVVQLLIAMIESQKSNLARIINDWEILEEALETNIANIQAIDDAQHAYCDSLSATIGDLEFEIARYKDFISQAQDSIETSQESLAQKADARCALSLVNTAKLKNSHDAIRLLEFLRASIADPGFKGYLGENNNAFMELAHHMKNNRKNSFGVVLKHHMLSVLFQNKIKSLYGGETSLDYEIQARTEAQIGHGHIDNSESSLDLDHMTLDARNIDDFIAELLGFVDKLIDDVHEDIAATRAAEANSVQDLIDYQDRIEHEAVVLNRYIRLWVQHVEDLRNTRDQTEDALEECEERAEELDASLEAAEEDYRERHNKYVHLRGMVQKTIDTLEEILELYQRKVASAAQEYKARWDRELSEKAHERSRENDLSAKERQSIQDQIRRDHEAQQPSEPSTVSVSEPSTVYESVHISAANGPSRSFEPSTESYVSASVVLSSSSSEEEEVQSNSNWVSAASESSSSSSGWNEPAPTPVPATFSSPSRFSAPSTVSAPSIVAESTVSAPTFVSESTVSAPVSESTVSAPVSESTVSAPVSESTISAPVSESTISAPVPESTVSVPATVPESTISAPSFEPTVYESTYESSSSTESETWTAISAVSVTTYDYTSPVEEVPAEPTPEPIEESESAWSAWDEPEPSSTVEESYAPVPVATVYSSSSSVAAPEPIPAPTQENPQNWFASESSEESEESVAAPAPAPAPMVVTEQSNPQNWFDESESSSTEEVSAAPVMNNQPQANAADLFPESESDVESSSTSTLGASAIAQQEIDEEANAGFLQRFWKAHH